MRFDDYADGFQIESREAGYEVSIDDDSWLCALHWLEGSLKIDREPVPGQSEEGTLRSRRDLDLLHLGHLYVLWIQSLQRMTQPTVCA